MSGVEDLLATVPLFAGLKAGDRRRLAASMKELTFPEGKVVAEEGKEGVGFFLVGSGTATVTVGGQKVRTLSSGDYFGDIALIDGGPRSAQVTADTELTCWGMTAWEFRPFVRDRPDVAWVLLTNMAKRLREADERSPG